MCQAVCAAEWESAAQSVSIFQEENMSEHIIARGERKGKEVPYKKIVRITAVIAAVILAFGLISSIAEAGKLIENHKHSKYCYKYSYRSDFYEDYADGNLRSYKMDCSYSDGALSLGVDRYMRGSFILPLMVLLGGLAYGYAMRARGRSYLVTVDEENIHVIYSDGKNLDIPLCSIFTVEKIGLQDLNIVTSENTHMLRGMEGCDAVYAAIQEHMPKITIKGPANNEQVLAKGYPPAIKPVLLVLVGLGVIAAVLLTIAAEDPIALLVFGIPVAILFLFYMMAKTPYLVVTDKRVFYVSDFGRKLSIPLNKITVTVTHHWFRQLHIGAPTGRIHLFWVRNTAELYDIIAALINEKQ